MIKKHQQITGITSDNIALAAAAMCWGDSFFNPYISQKPPLKMVPPSRGEDPFRHHVLQDSLCYSHELGVCYFSLPRPPQLFKRSTASLLVSRKVTVKKPILENGETESRFPDQLSWHVIPKKAQALSLPNIYSYMS